MSTTGKQDDAGDAGSQGRWKDGFNLDCGVTSVLLVDRPASGPWRIAENTRAPKNRYYVFRLEASEHWNVNEVIDLKRPVAWIGPDRALAERLCERLNGYEVARYFPPK